MKFNKDFVFGLVTGMALALILSLALFNYYVVKSIETTKNEAREMLEEARETFRGEVQAELKNLRERGWGILEGQKGEVIENIKGRIQDRIKKRQTEKDSLSENG